MESFYPTTSSPSLCASRKDNGDSACGVKGREGIETLRFALSGVARENLSSPFGGL